MSIINENNNQLVAPAAYAEAAVLANTIGEEMLTRLEWMALQPSVIVDVGCGVGYCASLLQARYPTATVIALDVAYPMLAHAKQQEKTDKLAFVCADALRLPLPDHSADIVFANLVLPWLANAEEVVREWRRVLRPGGLLMFTSLGPDTLQAWRDKLGDFTLPHFIDMHEIGDALTRVRFSDPVMDVDYFTLTYRERHAFFTELQASGMIIPACYENLIPDDVLLRNAEHKLEITYEVVYGHAWGPECDADHVADEFGTVKIPLAHLRRRW